MPPNVDRILIYILGLLLCFYFSSSKPNGSPKDSCFYMTPRHIHPHTYRKVFPTKPMGLYNITTSADVFRPDRPIRVTLWGPPFKGFMMVAAEEGAKDWPAGIFYSEDGLAKRMDCLGRGDTVTHQNNSYKDSVSVLWYGPENMMSEQIQFIATVVVNLTIYYTNIRSGFVRLDPSIHGAPAAGNEGAPVAVTMDPWLAGSSVTQAPTNWWNQGGSGGGRGTGSSSLLSSLSGLSGLTSGRGSRTGGSSVWTEGAGNWGSNSGSGSSWGSSGGSGSSWGNGGDWQQWGQGSLTSSNSGGGGWVSDRSSGSSDWGGSNGGSSWDSTSRGSGSSWGDGGSSWGGSSGGNSWGSNSGSSWDSESGSWSSRGSGSNTRTGSSWDSSGTGSNNDWNNWSSSSNGTGSSWSSSQDTWNTTPRSTGVEGNSSLNSSQPARPSNGKKIWSWSSGKATTTDRPTQTTASGGTWGSRNSGGAGGPLGSMASLGNLNFGNNAAAANTGAGAQWSANAVLDLLRRVGVGADTSNMGGYFPGKK